MKKKLYCIISILICLTACSASKDASSPQGTKSNPEQPDTSALSALVDGKWELTSRKQNDLEVINSDFQILITVSGSQQTFHIIQLNDGCTHSFPVKFVNSSGLNELEILRTTSAPTLSPECGTPSEDDIIQAESELYNNYLNGFSIENPSPTKSDNICANALIFIRNNEVLHFSQPALQNGSETSQDTLPDNGVIPPAPPAPSAMQFPSQGSLKIAKQEGASSASKPLVEPIQSEESDKSPGIGDLMKELKDRGLKGKSDTALKVDEERNQRVNQLEHDSRNKLSNGIVIPAEGIASMKKTGPALYKKPKTQQEQTKAKHWDLDSKTVEEVRAEANTKGSTSAAASELVAEADHAPAAHQETIGEKEKKCSLLKITKSAFNRLFKGSKKSQPSCSSEE